MFTKWTIFFSCALISASNAAFVETLSKCSPDDENCVKDLVMKVINDISQSGVEDLKIPATDPMHLQNLVFPIAGFLNMTLEDGDLTGLKDCKITSLHNDLDKGVTDSDVLCNLKLTGNFKISETSPFLQTLLGPQTIELDGKTRIELENLHLKMKFFYHLYKKDNGDIYFKCHTDKFMYEYEIGNAKLDADKILLGGQDATQLVVGVFNQNWKLLFQTFGNSVFEVGMPIFVDTVQRFFEGVPIKHFVIGDLSKYVKN